MPLTVPTFAAVTLGTSSTTVYTVPNTAGFYLIVKSIIVANTGATATTFSMARVASGSTEADSNRFLKAIPIAANETIVISETITLAPNESIRGTAAAASLAVVTLSGAGKVT